MLAATKQRYDLFVKCFAAGMFNNATQAAISAGYGCKSAGRTATRLTQNAYIKTEIARYKAETAEKIGETIEGVIKDLRTEVAIGKNSGERIRALELIGKHVGAFEKDNTQKIGKTIADIFAIVAAQRRKTIESTEVPLLEADDV